MNDDTSSEQDQAAPDTGLSEETRQRAVDEIRALLNNTDDPRIETKHCRRAKDILPEEHLAYTFLERELYGHALAALDASAWMTQYQKPVSDPTAVIEIDHTQPTSVSEDGFTVTRDSSKDAEPQVISYGAVAYERSVRIDISEQLAERVVEEIDGNEFDSDELSDKEIMAMVTRGIVIDRDYVVNGELITEYIRRHLQNRE